MHPFALLGFFLDVALKDARYCNMHCPRYSNNHLEGFQSKLIESTFKDGIHCVLVRCVVLYCCIVVLLCYCVIVLLHCCIVVLLHCCVVVALLRFRGSLGCVIERMMWL
jgi:hypothetical protein